MEDEIQLNNPNNEQIQQSNENQSLFLKEQNGYQEQIINKIQDNTIDEQQTDNEEEQKIDNDQEAEVEQEENYDEEEAYQNPDQQEQVIDEEEDQSSHQHIRVIKDEFLKQEQIYPMLLKQLEYMNNNMGLCLQMDALVLVFQYFSWKRNQLEMDYFNKQQKVFNDLSLDLKVINAGKNPGFCEICYEEFEEFQNSPFCEHQICDDCLVEFLWSKIPQKDIFIRCFSGTCAAYYRHSFIVEFLTKKNQPEYLQRYIYFLSKLFIENSQNAQKCRNRNCELFLRGKDIQTKSMICKCGDETCLKCGTQAHIPATCDQKIRWEKDYKSDDELTLQFIVENTVPCPFCKVNCSLNMGCNYVRCANPACKGGLHEGKKVTSFCIKCGGVWPDDNDGSHHNNAHMRCTQYVPNEADSEERKKTLFFGFLFERFSTINQTKLKCIEFRQENIPLIRDVLWNELHYHHNETQFLDIAMATLIQAREKLKWSYVVSFFLQSQEKTLFEFFQDQYSEVNGALTSLLTEQFVQAFEFYQKFQNEEIFRQEINDFKNKIVDLTKLVDKKQEDLIKYCDEL